MKHLIATAANSKIEEFLKNDWYRSLRENVDLTKIDVLIIDYGLNNPPEGVIIFPAVVHSGLINNTRFLNLALFLEEHPEYDQILFCDGGDIIFQKDISHLFEEHKDSYRAVVERLSPPIDLLVKEEDLINGKEIKSFLSEKRLFNVGMIMAPREGFIKLADEMKKHLKNMNVWGGDTVIGNFVMYKNSYVELPTKYNFIPSTAREKFYVKDSKFYLQNGELIPIVHNAGRYRFLRPVRNFGYGEGKNKVNRLNIFLFRISFSIANLLKRK
ncbi:glycosyltransferase [Thermotoga sp.]|uniref:glycosyltransferase n=1 Tax=Thermotoga sp. TaxID=28240 RepID=UPI0025EE2561|nr:glycosyltransferase [Thermotoga sp.]